MTDTKTLDLEALAESGFTDNIAGYPGYHVTREGQVISYGHNWRGHKIRELSQTLNAYGYPRVKLTRDGVSKRLRVHKLVAAAFLPPCPPDCDQIRHLDGDKENNHVRNLAWGNAKSNADDRTEHGTAYSGERHHRSTLTVEMVREIRRGGMNDAEFARKLGVSRHTVRDVRVGKTWRHVEGKAALSGDGETDDG